MLQVSVNLEMPVVDHKYFLHRKNQQEWQGSSKGETEDHGLSTGRGYLLQEYKGRKEGSNTDQGLPS